MIQRLTLGAAVMAIWALQTMITFVAVGATGQFSAKFISTFLN